MDARPADSAATTTIHRPACRHREPTQHLRQFHQSLCRGLQLPNHRGHPAIFSRITAVLSSGLHNPLSSLRRFLAGVGAPMHPGPLQGVAALMRAPHRGKACAKEAPCAGPTSYAWGSAGSLLSCPLPGPWFALRADEIVHRDAGLFLLNCEGWRSVGAGNRRRRCSALNVAHNRLATFVKQRPFRP